MKRALRFVAGAVVVLLLALLLAGGGVLWWLNRPLPLAAPTVELSIEAGQTPREVAAG